MPNIDTTGSAAAQIGAKTLTTSGFYNGQRSVSFGKIRVLIVGSSNAYRSNATTYANSWAGLLESALSATHEFDNVAIGGKSIQYWVDQDSAESDIASSSTASNLETAIHSFNPHIVIGSFCVQNSYAGASQSSETYRHSYATDFIRCTLKAKAITERNGAKYIGITPYGSNSLLADSWAMLRYIGNQLDAFGLNLIDFYKVWDDGGTTIPAAVDSGDGLHLNDAGHLLQYRAIPHHLLSLSTHHNSPIEVVGTEHGVTMPDNVETAAPFVTSAFPEGSWAVAMFCKMNVLGVFTYLSFGGSNSNLRLRSPAETNVELASSEFTSVAAPSFAQGDEQHWVVSFNQLTSTVSLYVNGVFAQSFALSSSNTYTYVVPAGYTSSADFTPEGNKFRDVVVYSTWLSAAEAKQLSLGGIPKKSLYGHWPLRDSVSRLAQEVFLNTYSDARMYTAIAI